MYEILVPRIKALKSEGILFKITIVIGRPGLRWLGRVMSTIANDVLNAKNAKKKVDKEDRNQQAMDKIKDCGLY